VEAFLSSYPALSVTTQFLERDRLTAGKRIILEVTLHQTVPGAEGCQANVRLQHPMKKSVYWMVYITIEDDILAMAVVTVVKTLVVRLEFTLPEEGEYELQLWVDCDSYMGLSQLICLDEIVAGS
jgi:pre-mRNA-splicing helicase BRR2